ncbi:pyocin large subunit-like protein [Acinetobacter baylyi]|uniref:Pyocin large subunit-like protein n=1 Tax=Acinetobacter baylyi TaxID=202950 RepID=A0ABU0V196_ACIBI|nr:pyocin large subunit-like protein [Acinetobacter baylyi]MDR6105821.1 pyocin large subunit-like protein [Acinetobacter baylyi]MDR6187460.1 pyocin large subunit-like protein [Acinetobacter baylyi]
MSLDASIWAWKAQVKNSSQRLVLLTLSDRVGETHRCYLSIKRMEKDTKLNRKTIIKVLDELEASGFIKDTGEISGNGVKVYLLTGVTGREDDSVTSPKNGTATSTNFGTQNLSRNQSIESKNKKTWLCLKKLREEISQANPEI